MSKLRLGVLVSGNGSNLQAILDAVAERTLDAEVCLVVSNVPGAGALARADSVKVPNLTISNRDYASRADFERALIDALKHAGAEWIALAGFMRILGPPFIEAFNGQVVNIHPALLPSFPGVHAQAKALEYGVKVAGCTVHFVDHGVDTGPIIAQRAVAVEEDDDVEGLSKRILVEEHRTYVEVLRWIAANRVERVVGAPGERDKVRIRPA